MAKKTKKQQAEGQLMEQTTKEQEQMKAQAMLESPEVVEPTIVEASEAEVFPEQSEVAAAPMQAEGVATEEVASQEATPAEKPVEKPKRVNKRPYLDFLKSLLEESQGHPRKELTDKIMAAFPGVNKGGVTTVVSDLKNPKYNVFKERAVVVTGGDKLVFADCVEGLQQTETAPPAEMVTAEAPLEGQAEQPAE